jgi:hypothetical protein
VVHIAAGRINGERSYRLSPAIVPPGAAFTPGREFFVSTNTAERRSGRVLDLWTLSGTATLAGKHPDLHLSSRVVPTQLYTDSGVAPQPAGPHPLGRSVHQRLGGIEAEDASVEAPVYLVDDQLAVVIPTGFGTSVAPAGRGVEWFVLNARTHSLVRQGYARVAGTQLMFPAVAVNPDGTGAVVMSAVGSHRYPSVVYSRFDMRNGMTGPLHVAANGVAPYDGFTCYKPLSDHECRWGDYSYAFATGTSIAMAGEFVGPVARIASGNYATFVATLR